MVNKNFLLNLKLLFNAELGKRIFSAMFFVPIFLFSLYKSGSLLFFLFIFFFLIILSELVNIFKLSNLKINIIIYSFIATFTLVFFPFYYFTLNNNFVIYSYVLLSIWIFDTFSYFGGNLFKGKKIFPRLSKGKTYSGSLTGFVAVILINSLISSYLEINLMPNLLFLALMICALSFLGDAYVSLLKRQSNLKDTGNLFIGHGGFLDRMDSFILVFFFFIIFDIHKLIYYA